jgi:hypothetical protein
VHHLGTELMGSHCHVGVFIQRMEITELYSMEVFDLGITNDMGEEMRFGTSFTYTMVHTVGRATRYIVPIRLGVCV